MTVSINDQEQRVCRLVFCQAPLEQRVGEKTDAFQRREFCGVSCASQHRQVMRKGKR